MFTPAILFYDVVLFIHITAVVLAFGVVFTYPVLDTVLRRKHPGDLAALHHMQVVLTQRFITPMMAVILVAGLYLALDRWSLGDPWISATFAILIVLFGLTGAVYGPAEKRAAEFAERDQRAGGGFSEEYEREAAKLARFGGLGLLLILVAIFLMTAKPGA